MSSSYNFTDCNDEGGTENNVPYDIEFLDGEFSHLAIVENPRYERANIVFNAKVNNGGVSSGDFGHAGRPGFVGGSEPAGTGRQGKYDEKYQSAKKEGYKGSWDDFKKSDIETELKKDKKTLKKVSDFEKPQDVNKKEENGIDIKKETAKAYLLSKDGVNFWVQKRWYKDGNLTPAGGKSYKEAIEQKRINEENKNKFVGFKHSWESEKAYGVDVKFENNGGSKELYNVRVFIPKSQVKDGVIPHWLYAVKMKEAYEKTGLNAYWGDYGSGFEVDNSKEGLYTIIDGELYEIIDDIVNNGWVTLDKTDEEGKPIRVYIEGFYGESSTEKNRKAEILKSYKNCQETKYDFSHTRATITDVQKKHIKKTINDILNNFSSKPIAQVEVRTLGGGALGLCTSSDKASILGLSSSLFSGKMTQEKWENSIKKGFHPKTDNKDMVTSVLTHEMGHVISVNNGGKTFWNEIEKIHSEYLKNVKKEDVKNPDFVSDYARVNKYEFVAEAFAQGQLSKKYGKYTKQVIDIMDKHLSKNNQLKLIADNSKNEDEIIWEEDFGGGYPVDEEAYKEFKDKQENNKKGKKEKSKNIDNCVSEVVNNAIAQIITDSAMGEL